MIICTINIQFKLCCQLYFKELGSVIVSALHTQSKEKFELYSEGFIVLM